MCYEQQIYFVSYIKNIWKLITFNELPNIT